MKRILQTKKGCGKVSSYDTFFYYILFMGVKTVEEAYADIVGYCVSAKTIHEGFFLDML